VIARRRARGGVAVAHDRGRLDAPGSPGTADEDPVEAQGCTAGARAVERADDAGPDAPEAVAFEEDRAMAESLTSNDQVSELADEFAVFQGETKNALTAVVSVVAVIGVLLLFINLVLIIK